MKICTECSTKLAVALDMCDGMAEQNTCDVCQKNTIIWPMRQVDLAHEMVKNVLETVGLVDTLVALTSYAWHKAETLREADGHSVHAFIWEHTGKDADTLASLAINAGFSCEPSDPASKATQ